METTQIIANAMQEALSRIFDISRILVQSGIAAFEVFSSYVFFSNVCPSEQNSRMRANTSALGHHSPSFLRRVRV